MPPDAWAQLAAMREEVTRLTRERDKARRAAMTGDLTGKVTTVVDMADYLALEAERDRLRALLREVVDEGCPFCQGHPRMVTFVAGRRIEPGHTPDCRLAAALEGRDG